jgi:hypothetical protein
MAEFFPRQSVEFHLEEPAAFRRLSRSLVEMAVVTGVVLRAYRALVLTHGADSWLYLGGALVLGILLLVAMLTAHLANYPVRRWLWRAPLFVLVEVGAEMATSALLIWAGREPFGSVRALMADWPALALMALRERALVGLLWAALLALVVTLVRRTTGEADDEPEDVALD